MGNLSTLKIEVTEEDIKNGIPCDGDHCPIALAVKRLTGKHCYVGGAYIEISEREEGFDEDGEPYWSHREVETFEIPRVAQDFVHDFDHPIQKEGQIVPFSFEAVSYED